MPSGYICNISDVCIDQLKRNPAVVIHTFDAINCGGVVEITSDEGTFASTVDSLEEVLDQLIVMIREGGNYNYRMEGKPEDWDDSGVKFYIANISN